MTGSMRPTVVTAFYDIGRGDWPLVVRRRILPVSQHRSVDKYFEAFARLASLRNAMVVFTTEDLADRVMSARRAWSLETLTSIVVTPRIESVYPDLMARLASTMDGMHKYAPSFLLAPHHPEYWNPAYVLINVKKADFVERAYHEELIESQDMAAWIDFGYCNSASVLGSLSTWEYPFADNRIHLFALHDIDPARPIFDIVRTGFVYISGGQIVGDSPSWSHLRERNRVNLETLLSCGLVDDDQTLLLMSYLDEPARVELHPIDVRAGWRVIFREFNVHWIPSQGGGLSSETL